MSGPGLSVALDRTVTPLNTADHAAIFVWFTPNRPRAAFSFGATVKRSTNFQSFVGCVPKLPDHSLHSRSGSIGAFKYSVCQGVPRCTRPIKPRFASLLVGNAQSSELVTPGSRMVK